jgi:hypothetical protein
MKRSQIFSCPILRLGRMPNRRSQPQDGLSKVFKVLSSITHFWQKLSWSLPVAALAWAIPATAAQDAQSSAIHWPRQDLVIPFQVDLNGQPPAEIQLEVSEDRGQTWSLYQRSDVRGKQFNFHAPRDGEYLFRLKTLDRFGAPIDNPGEPMRIVIDTAKPTGELLIDMDLKGELQGEFRLIDSALDTASVRMEYQTDNDPTWREVRAELERGIAPGEWVGFGTWSIPSSTVQIIVRVTARDAAGNAIELTRMPRLPRSASNGSSVKLASNRPEEESVPIGSGIARRFPTQRSVNPSSATSASAPSNLAPSNSVANGGNVPYQAVPGPSSELMRDSNAGARPNLIPSSLVVPQAAPRPQTLVSTTGLPLRSVDAPASTDFAHSNHPTGAPLAFPNANATNPNADGSYATPSSRDPKSLLVGRSNPPNHSQPAADFDRSIPAPNPISTNLPHSASTLQLGPPPTGSLAANLTMNTESVAIPSLPPTDSNRLDNAVMSQALHSNSKAFRLDYGIDNDPGAPISSVELWGTTDQGRTWDRWGTDSDRESPFDIEVETEGLFGFRMVIVGANGLASRRPLPGDQADSWINVDTTVPRSQIISALNGKGPDAGSLVIEYQALDAHFPDRPISVYYSETPKGPWIPITQGARNAGRFVWPADARLPEKVFLRLEAIDAAGNVGAHQLDLPVDVQSAAPRGRIQGFRPIQQ